RDESLTEAAVRAPDLTAGRFTAGRGGELWEQREHFVLFCALDAPSCLRGPAPSCLRGPAPSCLRGPAPSCLRWICTFLSPWTCTSMHSNLRYGVLVKTALTQGCSERYLECMKGLMLQRKGFFYLIPDGGGGLLAPLPRWRPIESRSISFQYPASAPGSGSGPDSEKTVGSRLLLRKQTLDLLLLQLT
ncbi:hypothetical protein KUCAC02_035220, partial [Chaenocephalus aceratus]